MKPFRLENALPVDTTIPDPSLVVLIGAAGSGKSTWASTWPDTQVLELDRFRALVSDDAGCQEATGDAVFALQAVLEARLARRKMTVVDATNCEKSVRANLIATARRHGVPTSLMLERVQASGGVWVEYVASSAGAGSRSVGAAGGGVHGAGQVVRVGHGTSVSTGAV
ncbi:MULTISPECIES: ATP-binding protein [unclassified Streptomyces]|uniref:ATP-binding protein n=1 Tax=unclassified Streptomyces TaxID=2593676 RepID=UPI002F9085A7